MRIYNHEELKRKIKSGIFAPVYFIYGNEPYLINHYINRIVEQCVTALPEINIKTYDTDFDVDDIISTAYQVPMMSNYRCIILNDLDVSKLSSDEMKALTEMATSPSDVSIVIFKYLSIDISLDNSYKAKKLSQNFKELAKAVEEGEGIVAEINRMSIGEISKILISGALKRSCTLDSSVARYMIEVCSDDLTTLLCEIEKLCSYLGSGTITKEHIDKICIRSVNARIFDMSKLVLSNNAKGSLAILEDLLYQKVKDSEIIFELSKTYIDIYRMSTSKRANVSQKEVEEYFEYGKRSFALNTASNFASKLTYSQIDASLEALCETEMMLKGGSKMKKSDILKMLIIKLIMISSGNKSI